MTGSDQKQYESTSRLIQSYSSDLVYGVTRGKVITAKHFLLGLGFHNITGQKKPVEINQRLGHSINYKFVCEIETALAEAAQVLANENGALPVKFSSDNETVLTFFWADNFDMKVETQTGKGSIHSTHMVAFQELSQMSVITKKKVELERTKRRTLEKSEIEARNISVDPNKEPPCILDSVYPQETNFDAFPEETEYLIWIVFGKLNAAD